ncbi:MAG: hypothetical protein PHQ71_05160 [Candidatus Hydrothermia bacterium]|nr:hypothetical protein [Candidatus Hydrothermia bacterium]MDD5573143.1 hypothetical protein [Candidatus Hydrothermia bacterium]
MMAYEVGADFGFGSFSSISCNCNIRDAKKLKEVPCYNNSLKSFLASALANSFDPFKVKTAYLTEGNIVCIRCLRIDNLRNTKKHKQYTKIDDFTIFYRRYSITNDEIKWIESPEIKIAVCLGR